MTKTKIKCTKCIFRERLFFNIDTSEKTDEELELIFVDRLISKNKQKSTIVSAKKTQKLFLYFNSCFIEDLELVNCKFTNASFFKSIILDRLVITNSYITVLSIRNSFGPTFITNNPKSHLFITYAAD